MPAAQPPSSTVMRPPRGRRFPKLTWLVAAFALFGLLGIVGYADAEQIELLADGEAEAEAEAEAGMGLEDDSSDMDVGGLLSLIDIVVTPAKKEQTIEQAPSIVSVIKAAEIEENGYKSVGAALQQVPGVYVRDDLIHPNVSMRGVDAGLRAWSRNLKVMINGQPISYRSDTSNWLGPELMPMDSIARIEVLRGPGSTLYGANAFLGVINIITKDADKKEWASASVHSGAGLTSCPSANRSVGFEGNTRDLCSGASTRLNPTMTVSASVGHELELSKTTTLNFLASTTLGYTDRTGLMLPATSPHFIATGPKYFSSGDINDVTSVGDTDKWLGAVGHVYLIHETLGKLSVEGHYTEFQRFGEFTDWGVLTRENRVAMRNWYVRLGHERRLRSLPITYRLSASFAGGNHSGANHLQIARDNTFWVKKVGGYLGLDVNAEVAYDITPKITLISGTTLTTDFHDLPSIYSVEDSPDPGGESIEVPSHLQGDTEFINFAVFAQLLYSPIDSLSLIGGVSFENHNVYDQSLHSRVGASYSFARTRDLSLYGKLLYGSSFKAPSAELLYGTPYVVSGISGNLDLEPQVAHTFEAALGSGVMLAERRVRLDLLVNGFFNLVNGKVEYIQAGNFTQAMNSSDLATIGVESTLKVSYKKAFSSYLNLSWQKTGVRECLLDDSTLCRKQGEFNALYPALLLSFGGVYRFAPAHLRASLYGVFVGSRWASQSNRAENIPSTGGSGFDSKAYTLPAYLRLNLVISTMDLRLFAGRETVFSLGFFNLLNAGIIEPGFSGIDTPNLGLTILGSMKQRF